MDITVIFMYIFPSRSRSLCELAPPDAWFHRYVQELA